MSKVEFCAEIGSSHQGDLSLAYELIRKSAWAGADLVKFQLGWTPEAEKKYAPNSPAIIRRDMSGSARYIDDWAEQLNEWCEKFSVEFFASIWSFEGLEVARKVGMKRYKIAHQMRDYKLIGEVMNDNKEIFLSGILADEEFKLIYTTKDYPTFPDSTRIPLDFRGSFYGYSSHMHGIGDALIAVARGAQYIEKHITLDKTMPFPRDNSFALLPEEFRTMVDVGNEMVALR